MNKSVKAGLGAFVLGCAVSFIIYSFLWVPTRSDVRGDIHSNVISALSQGIKARVNTVDLDARVIKVNGYLEVKDSMRIGSLVSGIIKKMYVQENEIVQKGQLLVEIDDGKDDTEVRQGKSLLDKATAERAYTEKFYERQSKLYQDKHISDDAFQSAERNYAQAKAAVELARGAYDKTKLEFDNKSIKAPDAGLVIHKGVREGETVALTSPATIIYTIAKDMKCMEALISIPESKVAHIKAGMKVRLLYQAYPETAFEGEICMVSRAARIESGTTYYTAVVQVDNSKMLFSPGMTLQAQIAIG